MINITGPCPLEYIVPDDIIRDNPINRHFIEIPPGR
jgi:hypothetical protein